MRLTEPSEKDAARNNRALRRLLAAVQELSLARSLEEVMKIVRTVARELTVADGATFILREHDQCHYVDEDAIGPLWKGQRFPMTACVSGWAMLHRQPAMIVDIFDDPRVPVDAYRPTFVKSLLMVPIRTEAPIGAIGTYWARSYQATPLEIELLQTLANTTSVALENVQVYAELEQRVRERTRQLQAANEELEAFSYSVSHDLRSPLSHISGFTHLAQRRLAPDADPRIHEHLAVVHDSVARMQRLIDDLLRMAALGRKELRPEEVSLSGLAREIVERLRAASPGRKVTFHCAPDLVATGDEGLLRAALENLLGNAWKYSGKQEHADIEFGRLAAPEGGPGEFFVRDNGVGFDMKFVDRLFKPFKRLHSYDEFEGTGVGLATVRRIIERHGGRIRAEGVVNEGATFFFTIPDRVPT